MSTLIHATLGKTDTLKAQLDKKYSHILALVAHPDLQDEMQQLAANHPQLEWQPVALATKSAEAQINLTNLPAASSLQQPSGIKKLYPNLQIEKTEPVQCTSLDELLKQDSLKQEKNLSLILETNGQEAEILQQLIDNQQLHRFQEIQTWVGQTALYKNAASSKEITQLLEAQAYEIQVQKQADPEHPLLTFKLNKKQLEHNQKITKLKQENEDLQTSKKQLQEDKKKAQSAQEQLEQDKEHLAQERDQLKKEKEALVAEKNDLKEQLKTTEEKLAETHKWFTNRKKEALESQEKIKELTYKLELSQKDYEQAQKELKNQEEQNSQLTKLQERLDYLFNQQTLQLEQAANALGQHITQRSQEGTEEVKSFIQVQQQLGSNTQALNYQNQQLAANLALYLKQRLATNNYNLIVDLGAGVSTNFLATQLQEQAPTKARISQANRQQPEAYPLAEEGELPKRILAFSHQRQACKELSEHLQQQGQQHLVDIVFTPLVDCRLNGQDYLYYDASKTLSRIADLLEKRQGKLLVLLNLEQQPEQLNPEASLPSLLQHLASQNLEVVIYPLNHPKTGQMQDTWTQLLKQRELEYHLQEEQQSNSLVFKIN